MNDWTSGYVADVAYTFGYYNELNPNRLKLVFLNAGLALPKDGAACELGFGQGLSTNIHAAASVTQWYGTDFNPTQAGFAQELAEASGATANLYDESFDEFCQRGDLPEFDYIGLHGIWSWISDENRRTITEFIRRKLKVGGVLYISYNTLPGWAAFAPMRHLLTEHASTIGAEGHGIISRINGALEFAEKLLATNPMYAAANPQIAERIRGLSGQNRHYLAHEYFNRDWHPMHFATMADWLIPAKLSFACSAHYTDHVDSVNLTQEQREFLGGIPDLMFRETVRDYMVNQQFRRDYWVKGPRRLNTIERLEALRAHRVMLGTYRPSVVLKVAGARGEATMNDAVYAPILDLMADHKTRSLGEIEEQVQRERVSFSQLVQAVLVLTGAGYMAAVQDDDVIRSATPHTERLNSYLMNKARSSADISYLASPVTGGGIPVGRFSQLFLLASAKGLQDAEAWAQFAWQQINDQGQRIIKDGKRLESPEENLAELTMQARAFEQKDLPTLKSLLIA